MTVRTFIKNNRKEIDQVIKKALDTQAAINDTIRHLWILNEESLYLWARSEGVRI